MHTMSTSWLSRVDLGIWNSVGVWSGVTIERAPSTCFPWSSVTWLSVVSPRIS